MKIYLTLLKKELLEQFRSKKILILAILFLFVAMSSVIFAKLMPEIFKSIDTGGIDFKIPDPTFKDAIDQFAKNISQMVIFVLLFVVAGAVTDEKSKKTLELLLSKPIPRSSFILAKFSSYILTIKVIYIIASLMFYFYAVSIFGAFSFLNFALMAILILLYVLLIVSFTFFASSISNSTIGSAGLGFAGLIFFSSISSLIKPLKKYNPYKLISDYQTLISNGWKNEFLWPTLIALLLIALFIYSSIALFKKQEIER